MKDNRVKYKIGTTKVFIIIGFITSLTLGLITLVGFHFLWLPSAIISSISLFAVFVTYYPKSTARNKLSTRHSDSQYMFLIWIASHTAILFTLSRPSVCFVRVGLVYEWASVVFLPCFLASIWAIISMRYENKVLLGVTVVGLVASSVLWLPLSDSILLNLCDNQKQDHYIVE